MLEIILLIFVIILLYHFWVHRNFYRLLWKLPRPSLWSTISDFAEAYQTTHYGGLILKILQKYLIIYKRLFVYWNGNAFYVVIKDPEDIKVVLNSPHCLNRSYFYKFLSYSVGYGVAFFDTPKWNYHRRCLNPSFNATSVQSYLPIFNKQAKILVSCMEELCDKKEPTNIAEYVKPFALDTIFETTMGVNLNIQKDLKFKPIFDSTNKIGAIVSQRFMNPLLHLYSIYKHTSLYKKEKEGTTIYVNLVKMIIKERQKIWEENLEKSHNSKNMLEDFELSKAPLILLDKLFNLTLLEKKITNEEMFANASNIISGGYKTTGSGCAYCLLMLAMFPQHQEKIYEEIISIMPNKRDDIHCENLSKYEFLERFIMETLRLFPSIPIIAKKVTETIQLGEYTIPAGINIMCSKFFLHRDKEIWGPNAENFDPDHFLPENIENMHPYSFLTFSGGPRNCIGGKYAHMVLKVMLIYVVSNFKLHTDLKLSDLDFKADISLNIYNKHMIYIEKRDN